MLKRGDLCTALLCSICARITNISLANIMFYLWRPGNRLYNIYNPTFLGENCPPLPVLTAGPRTNVTRHLNLTVPLSVSLFPRCCISPDSALPRARGRASWVSVVSPDICCYARLPHTHPAVPVQRIFQNAHT